MPGEKGGWGHSLLSIFILKEADGRERKEVIGNVLKSLMDAYGPEGAYRAIRGSLLESRMNYWIRKGILEERNGVLFLTEKGRKIVDEAEKLMKIILGGGA